MNKRTTSPKGQATDQGPPADVYGMTPADYVRLRAKTDADVVADCKDDPAARPPSDASPRRPMRRIARVKLIRERLRLSQSEFAKTFRIPLASLSDWEQHKAEPDRAMRAYLAVIAAEPDTVRKALLAEPTA